MPFRAFVLMLHLTRSLETGPVSPEATFAHTKQRMLEKGFSGAVLQRANLGAWLWMKATLPQGVPTASGCGLGPTQGLAAIAQGLGDMNTGDLLLAVEVREGARDAKGAVVAAGAERERVRCLAKERQPGAVGCGDFLEQRTVAFGVGADTCSISPIPTLWATPKNGSVQLLTSRES